MKHLLLLLLFVLNACDHDNEKATIVTSFPQTGKLQAQVTQLPVPVLLLIRKDGLYPSFLSLTCVRLPFSPSILTTWMP